MNTTQCTKIIYERLQNAFNPSTLNVTDDSEQHRGHVGSQSGAGHYTVTIEAGCLKGQSRITAHRMIYAVLADLMPNQVHALQIKIIHTS